MPTLLVTLADGKEVKFELTDTTVTVGRSPENQICIDDISVSSSHAKLTLKGKDYVFEDLDSTNGSRYNGEPSKGSALEDGDRIRFGKVEANYVSGAKTDGSKPMPKAPKAETVVADSSHRPTDFSNASPFKTKKAKKNPAGRAVLIFAAVAMLFFLVAVLQAFLIQAPQ